MPSFLSRAQRFLTTPSRSASGADRARLLHLLTGRKAADLDVLSKRIILPSLPMADEDMTRLSVLEQGRKLARQDRWDELSGLIQLADDARLATPGGYSEAVLLVMGAHGDVVAAAADALADGRAPGDDGLTALDDIARDEPGNYPRALVAAMAHLRVAQAWKASDATSDTGDAASRVRDHCQVAHDLLKDFDASELDAPSVAAAQCALAEGLDVDKTALIETYARLIELDPHSPQNLQQLGPLLLPARGGDYDLLDTQATRLSDATQEVWGNGGYVWVWIDALKRDPAGLRQLDSHRFAAGLEDILKSTKNQHTVNELAAFCALSMAPGRFDDLSKPAEKARARLHACQDWILARHLYELHPYTWAETQQSGSVIRQSTAHRALVARGRKTALHLIAQRFADQLADGGSIAFSPAGMYRLPAI